MGNARGADEAIYTGETVVAYFYLYDAEVENAPIDDPSEVRLTMRKPDGTTPMFSLTEGTVGSRGGGEYRVRFDADGGEGTYDLLWEGRTHDGSLAVSVDRLRVKARPFGV